MIFQLSQAMAEIKERGRADFFFFVVPAGLHIARRLIDAYLSETSASCNPRNHPWLKVLPISRLVNITVL